MTARLRLLLSPAARRRRGRAARLAEARRCLRTGDHATALRLFAPFAASAAADELLRWELSTARWSLVAGRVEALWDGGDESAAVALVQTALAAFPDEPEFSIWLGSAAVVHERYEDAAHHARRAARLDPGNPATLLRVATFGRWGDVAHARSCLETVKDLLVARDPGHPFPLLADVPRLEAQVLWSEGRTEESLVWLRHAAAFTPGDHHLAADLAQALLQSGERTEAWDVLEDALRANPGEPALLRLRDRAADA